MADDQNKSGKGDPNRIPDYIDQSSIYTRAEEIRQQHSVETLAQAELKKAIAETRERSSILRSMSRTPSKDPNVLWGETEYYRQELPELRRRISRGREQLRMMDVASSARAESEMRTSISREYSESHIGGRVAQMSRLEQVQNQSLSYAGRPFDELEAEKQELVSRLRQSKRLAAGHVPGMYRKEQGTMITDPEKMHAIGEELAERDRLVRQIAQINIAQKTQKISGADPSARFAQLLEKGEEARKILSAKDDTDLARTDRIILKGKEESVKRSDIEREIVNQSINLKKALEELEKAAKDGAKNLDELRENAQDAADNLDTLQKASRGGGSFGGFSAGAWGRLAAFGQGAAIIGDTAQKILVRDEIQSMRNITGYASIENEKYNTYKAARGGNVAAQLALAQYSSAEEFARGIKTRTGITEALMGFGSGLAKIGGGGAAIAGASAVGTPALGALVATTGGGLAVASGVADLATTTSGLVRGTHTGQSYQMGVNAYMEAINQINAIPAAQMQSLRDLYVGAGNVGVGMGANAEGFLNQITGRDVADRRLMEARSGLPLTPTLLERTAKLGISPEQLTKLSQVGTNVMGNQFNVRQVEFAKQLELANLGTANENIMRMGMLTAAGANNPQSGLETVMASAVEKGLNTSKAISAMVENTAALSSASGAAVMGLDATNAATAMASSLLNPNIQNEDIRATRARTVQELAMSSATNTSVTFSGMVNTSRASTLAKSLGIDPSAADIYTKLDPVFYRSLLDPKNKDRMLDIAAGQGIYSADKNPETIKKFAMGMLENQSLAIMEGGGAAYGRLGSTASELYKKVRSTENINQLELGDKAALAQVGKTAGYGSAEEFFAAIRMPSATQNAKLDLTKTTGKTTDEIKELRIGSDKQAAEAAAYAEKMLSTITKGFGDALGVLSELNNKYSKDGAEQEAEFSTAAVKAAASFGDSTKRFDSTVTRLEQTVNALAAKAGLPAISSKAPTTPTVPYGRPMGANPGQE